MSMRANNCPSCGSSTLLRHVRQGQIYWLCQSCRQEMQPLTVTRLSGVEVRTAGIVTQSGSDS
jgi:ribosomal protein L37AE/L43A